MPYDMNIIGWMPENDLIALESLALCVPQNGVVVEVGSLFGKSSVCWALTCHSSVKIHCIDTFLDSYIPNHGFADYIAEKHKFPLNDIDYNIEQEFKRNTSKYPNINQIKAWVPHLEFNEEIDLFFLDANHENPNDWDILRKFVPLIKAGGILCGHDYNTNFPDVIANVEKLESIIGKSVTRYTGSTVWSFSIDQKIDELPPL